MNNRVVHFEIQVDNPERAMKSYGDVFGMAWQGYFLDTEGNTFGLHQLDKNAK